jgi:hypothetical protein
MYPDGRINQNVCHVEGAANIHETRSISNGRPCSMLQLQWLKQHMPLCDIHIDDAKWPTSSTYIDKLLLD